jgi:hypothetical protein
MKTKKVPRERNPFPDEEPRRGFWLARYVAKNANNVLVSADLGSTHLQIVLELELVLDCWEIQLWKIGTRLTLWRLRGH